MNDVNQEEQYPSSQSHKGDKRGLVNVTALLLIIVLPALILPSVLNLIALIFSIDLSGLPRVTLTLIFQTTMLILYLYVQRHDNLQISPRKINENFTFIQSLKTWYLGWGLLLGLSFLIQILLSPLVNDSTESVYEGLISTPIDIVLLLITAAVMAPIVEELIFRKFLIDRLETTTSENMSLILSALLFSSIHWLSDILGSSIDFTVGHIFSTFILGLILGYIYQKSGNILYPILIHAINNAIGVIGLIILNLFPVTSEELDLFSSGETDSLTDEALRNISFVIGTNLVIGLFAVIAIIWGIIRLVKNRDRYFTNFNAGLRLTTHLFVPNHIYSVIVGLMGFVILPLFFIILIPSSNSYLSLLSSNLGNFISLIIATWILVKD